MPKKQEINPKELLNSGYDKLKEIPCYTYDKNLSQEIAAKNVTKEDAIEMFKQMIIARKFDDMLFENKTTGSFKKISFLNDGPLHVSTGQEAACVGQMFALTKDDFIFGTHRNHAEVLSKGLSAINKMSDKELTNMMNNHFNGKVSKSVKAFKKFASVKQEAIFFFLYGVLGEIFTVGNGLNKGMGGSMHMFFTPLGIYPNNAVVGASPSIAQGAALYKLINKKPGVVIANLGDGAIATGPVWEAMNFMAMDQYKMLWDKPYNKRPPFMMNITNNSYAMGGQPVGETMGNKGVARIGIAIKPEQMHAERINGQNVLAVLDAQKRQGKLALDGEGPILTEIMTYRFEGHSSADGVQPYRSKEEVDAWRKYDPIDLFAKELIQAKVLNKAKITSLNKEIDTLIFEVYKISADEKLSPFLDWTDDQLLDELTLSTKKVFVSESDKKSELLQPLKDNDRIKQLAKKHRYALDKDGKEVSALRQYQIRDAIFEAVAQEAEKDPTLIVFGEEHRDWGGPYAVWRGLTELLPYHRFFNSIIGEAAIVGAATGYAMCGGKAVVEIMYFDFLFRAGDEITNQAAKWRAMSGGVLEIPLVIRANIGANYGAQHSQDYTSVMAHIPGLKVVSPVTPYDAKGLMKAAIDDPNPVIYVEQQTLYGKGEMFVKEGVPEEPFSIEIGEPAMRRTGEDITILAFGSSLYPSLEAAKRLEEEFALSADVIDARSAVPFNYEMVVESVKKTGRIILINNGVERSNFMRHMASTIMELAFDYLDAPAVTLGAKNWIMPGAGLDKYIYPQVENILSAINEKIVQLEGYVSERNETTVELFRKNKKGV